MKTEILAQEDLSLAIDSLKQGELVAFPTETVYGLGASAFDEGAIRKIFAIKGRPADNPLIVHISSMDQVSLLAEEVPPEFLKLARAFWPGPLTLILKRKGSVPAICSAGLSTIAIRMPVHQVALDLIRGVGAPLAAPSANLSGAPSPTTAQDVLEDMDGKIPYILDGGPSAIGLESTVLSLVSPRPILFRPGAVSKEALEEVLGRSIDLANPATPALSPGMKYRHYAPKAAIRLVFNESDLKGPYTLPRITARNLYSELRKADRLGVPEVEIYCSSSVQTDPALMNRLLRASGALETTAASKRAS